MIIQLDDELGVSFPYDEDLVAAIKEGIPGRRFIDGYWLFPIRHADVAAEVFRNFDTDIARDIKTHRAVIQWGLDEEERLAINSFDTSDLAEEFPDLMKHQLQVIEFGRLNNGRFLLCDDAGLGKTAASLSFLEKHRPGMQTLIICPSSVKFNWAMEVKRWTDSTPTVHSKRKAKELQIETSKEVVASDHFIISYESFAQLKSQPHGFQNLILDEFHLLKNVKTKRAKAVVSFARRANLKSIIGLSGTPLRNRPVEMFTVLNLIKPTEFPSWYNYAFRYCGAKEERYGITYHGATNMDELNMVLKSCMIRRTDEILDLPSLTINHMWWNPPQMVLDDVNFKMFAEAESDNVLPLISQWREDIGVEKARGPTLPINDTPVVIFYHHKATEQNFAPDHEKIDGSTTDYHRAEIVERFQRGEIPILLVSTTAAGQGINLTAAANVILLERQYTPAEEWQAIKRCHRIGQTRPVTVTIINARGTVDEAIHNLLERKKAIFDNVLDGITAESISHENIMEEMRKIAA